MKINSNTVLIKKGSQEYLELENALLKVASANNVKDISGIEISLDQDKGLVSFKQANDEILGNKYEDVLKNINQILNEHKDGFISNKDIITRIFNLINSTFGDQIKSDSYSPEGTENINADKGNIVDLKI